MMDGPTPTLTMLWEDENPDVVIRERFGLASPEATRTWVATMLHQHWDVTVDACERVIISADNALAWVSGGSQRLVLKWSVRPERFDRLRALAMLTAWLRDQGLPVSAPISTPRSELQVETDGASLSLQREMRGDLLDPTDLTQARAAGRALAQLHEALAQYPHAATLDLGDRPTPLASRVIDWLDSEPEGVSAVVSRTLRRLAQDAPPIDTTMQPVHGDFRSANVLCASQEVAAVLDFEEARWDHPIDELARSAVLLGTRYRDWGPVPREARDEFLGGYQSVRQLDPAEQAWWGTLVPWYSLRMAPASGEDPMGWGAAAEVQIEELRRSR